MTRFNSISTSYAHLSTVLIVLLIILNHCSASANKVDYQNPANVYDALIYDDIDDNAGSLGFNPKTLLIADSHERTARNPWAQMFRYYHERPRYPSYRRLDSPSGFYPKRSIPIELQKALFAHGIVGRRR